MPDPTIANPAAPAAQEPPRQCRSLNVDGVQCKKPALRGNDLCFQHRKYRERHAQDGKMAVPLLESHASIRFMLSEILQALLDGELAANVAGKSIYCCQVAVSTLPRPTAPEAAPGVPESHPEPVVDTVAGPDGEPLGPSQPYLGPTGSFEPTWSMAKYMYEEECERLSRPKPTCAADMPLSGWLTPEEMKEDPDAFTARYHARIKKLIEANPPQPLPPDCPFGFDWCRGPAASHHCNRCQLLIEDRAAKAAQEAVSADPPLTATVPGSLNLKAVAANASHGARSLPPERVSSCFCRRPAAAAPSVDWLLPKMPPDAVRVEGGT